MAVRSTALGGTRTGTGARARAWTPRRVVGRALIYLILGLGAVASGFPFFWMLTTALKTKNEAIAIPPTILPASPQWGNFARAWNADPFARYFLNTTLMCAGIVLGVLATTVLAAYAFARFEFRGKNIIFALFLATMMIPFEATLIPNYMIIRGLGWVDTYAGLIVPFIANVFSIFLLRQFFLSIPQELYDAASLDGCGHLRTLWNVAMPLARAPLSAIVIFNFLWGWNSLIWPLIMTRREEMRPIQLGLTVFVNAEGNDPHLLMAASTFTILPIVVLYFLAQRQFIEGIASSGLKG